MVRNILLEELLLALERTGMPQQVGVGGMDARAKELDRNSWEHVNVRGSCTAQSHQASVLPGHEHAGVGRTSSNLEIEL